jgi:glycosyltransferase involved in cell wall biosynthesis
VDRILSLAKNVSGHNMDIYLVNRLGVGKSLQSFLVDPDKYYRVKNGVTREFSYPLYVRFLFPGLTKLLQEILSRLITTITFTKLSKVSPIYLLDPYLIAKLFYVCRKERIDLIQCELPMPGLSSFVVKKLLDIPLVYDAHNVETERISGVPNVSGIYVAIVLLIENTVCRICDSVFAVSERDKDQLASRGIPEGKITVIPNSIDTRRLSNIANGSAVRQKHNLKGKTVLIFHGPFKYPPNEEAAALLTTTILPEILAECPDVYLLLVGEHPPKIAQDHVIATGFVENLYDYIAAADVAVVPLLSGSGTRIKILEYMACGKPIVSTSKGAEGLALENGRDIFMTKCPDSEFVGAVLRLIANRDLRRNMGVNAKKKAQLHYDWTRTAEKAVEAYSGLIHAFGEKNRRTGEVMTPKRAAQSALSE